MSVEGSKTGLEKTRSVGLLRNLRARRMAAGNPAGAALIVARPHGEAVARARLRNWSRRHFRPAAVAAGIPHAVPYDLRHTYASLRLAEQRLSLHELAEETGHCVQVLADTYAHVIADLRGVGPDRPRHADRRRPAAPQERANRGRAGDALRRTPRDAESRGPANQPAPQNAPKRVRPDQTSEADGGTRTPDPIITRGPRGRFRVRRGA